MILERSCDVIVVLLYYFAEDIQAADMFCIATYKLEHCLEVSN